MRLTVIAVLGVGLLALMAHAYPDEAIGLIGSLGFLALLWAGYVIAFVILPVWIVSAALQWATRRRRG